MSLFRSTPKLLFIILSGLFSLAASAHGTSGLFQFMSELEPNFPKAPYLTGNRSCKSFYSPKGSRSSVAEIKAAAPKLGEAILESLIETQVRNSTYLTVEMARQKYDLSFTLCRGATVYLIQEMDRMNLRLEADAVITRDSFITFNLVLHVYAIDRNYFGEGKPLIIDPTIRQFFKKSLAKEDMERLIPEIFIGTPEELRSLFQTYLQPDPYRPKVTADDVVDTYLKTRSHTKIFDPTY